MWVWLVDVSWERRYNENGVGDDGFQEERQKEESTVTKGQARPGRVPPRKAAAVG